MTSYLKPTIFFLLVELSDSTSEAISTRQTWRYVSNSATFVERQMKDIISLIDDYAEDERAVEV